ncbi:MAG: hypothetical protein WD356_00145, partial [Pseudomonadales bacterium]
DTTNAGDASGAGINIVGDDGAFGTIDAGSQATSDVELALTAGTGDISLGQLGTINPIYSLSVDSANNIDLTDLFVSGNSIDIASSGDVAGVGVVQESLGDITVVTDGSITFDETVTATQGTVTLISGEDTVSVQQVTAGDSIVVEAEGNLGVNDDMSAQTGTLSLTSSSGSVEIFGSLDSSDDLTVRSGQSLLLGSNVTSSNGTVTLRSTNSNIVSNGIIDAGGNADVAAGDTVTLNQTISAAGDTNVAATGDITVNGTDGLGLTAGNNANVRTTSGDLLFNSDVETGSNFSAFSVEGEIAQAPNTSISADGSATLSAETGIKIASIDAASDVNLVITKATAPSGDRPLFERVNDPESGIDVLSSQGSIIYLSPTADVGTADNPLVQRAETAGEGIFYGLSQGEAFSVDIGVSQILPNAPSGFSLTNLVNDDILTLGQDIDIGLPEGFALNFEGLLSTASNTRGRVGQTDAAANSRSTEASQREDEEEVAEVDEAAFQDLRNYDENPQGIRLPPDQRFAYDHEGNIYFIVTLPASDQRVAGDSFVLYRVNLDLAYDTSSDDEADRHRSDLAAEKDYRPSLIKLSLLGNHWSDGDSH